MVELRNRRTRVLDAIGQVRSRVALTALFMCGLVLAIGIAPQGAAAQTTHKFLRHLTLPKEGGEPFAVDASGNLLVWFDDDSTIRKFSPNGAPVNFSALGTNVLDG